MSVTVATMVNHVRDILGDTPWMQGSASASSSSSTITVSDGTRWDEGSIMEFQTAGYEQAWVQSVSVNTVTALRGVRGTTAATQASGTVFLNPVYSGANIISAMNLVIQGLFPYVYKVVDFPSGLTYSGTTYWYDLADAAIGLVSVTQKGTEAAPRVNYYGKKNSGYSVAFGKNLPTTVAASGTGLAFPRGWYNKTNVINVRYAAALTTNSTLTLPYDGVTYFDFSDGLMADMIAYGTAARLVKNYEVNRVSDEDTGMGDQSVQPGMRFNIGLRLEQEFIKMRDIKREELRRTSPIMGTRPGIPGLSDSPYRSGVPY